MLHLARLRFGVLHHTHPYRRVSTEWSKLFDKPLQYQVTCSMPLSQALSEFDIPGQCGIR
jgi:hypothetical protein